MYRLKFFILFILFCVSAKVVVAQNNDSLPVATMTKPMGDSIPKAFQKPQINKFLSLHPEHTPQGATRRSMILPGWGQAYNHEYWKVPLAVAAVGIPIYLFIDNNKEYKKARFAYSAVFNSLPLAQGGNNDDSQIPFMDKKFKEYYDYSKDQANGKQNFLTSVRNYRNQFRQYRDYSILAILIGWGLNVADATVFGHLREFDVSPDLSMNVRPTYFKFNRSPGISLSFNLK